MDDTGWNQQQYGARQLMVETTQKWNLTWIMKSILTSVLFPCQLMTNSVNKTISGVLTELSVRWVICLSWIQCIMHEWLVASVSHYCYWCHAACLTTANQRRPVQKSYYTGQGWTPRTEYSMCQIPSCRHTRSRRDNHTITRATFTHFIILSHNIFSTQHRKSRCEERLNGEWGILGAAVPFRFEKQRAHQSTVCQTHSLDRVEDQMMNKSELKIVNY